MWNLPLSVLLGVIVAGKIILFFLCWLVWRTYHEHNARRESFGQSRMIGLRGKALTGIEREGRVIVRGEYWWARARAPIAAGENVRVIGIDGMLLEVESCPDKALIPRPVSAVAPAENEIQ